MVFQNYALYPHMTVAENMGFALKIAGKSKSEIDRAGQGGRAVLDLTEYLDRKPKALSGGQRQRVAMGRAIVRNPQVFCMDEPLSNLDAKLRVATRTQIASLQRRLGVTTVYVTHDQVEAMTMGDRVAVLKDGVLQQVDTPAALYDRPANMFVAGFIGSPAMNLFPLPLTEGGVVARAARDPAGPSRPRARPRRGRRQVTLGVRPEAVGCRRRRGLPVVVELVEELGSDAYVYGRLQIRLRVRSPRWGAACWCCGPTRAGHRRRVRSCTWRSARERRTSSPRRPARGSGMATADPRPRRRAAETAGA